MPALPRSIHRPRVARLAAALGLAAGLAPIYVGCSEAPPLIPRGGWTVAFADEPPATCGPGADNRTIGTVDANARNDLKDDGVDGISVSCSVIDSGSGGFEIQAVASGNSSTLTIALENLTSAATKESPAKGAISFSSPATQAAFTSTDCNFYFVAGTDQGVSEGQFWVTFECPVISAAPDNVCSITIGYAAFEQCRTKDDE